MARLTLVRTGIKVNSDISVGHRASASEGEAAKRLLEDQGYPCKRTANGQMEFRCPFHEGPGPIEARKGTNFYVDAKSSKYDCHAAGCGERGNLRTLERFFGIEVEDDYVSAYTSREERLREFERQLTKERRKPFYDHGLTDTTIERFRLGFECAHAETYEEDGQSKSRRIPDRYVIPYLEGRRPLLFRYYNPDGDPKWKYTWEEGATARLYNAQDALGDKDGLVFLCEGEQKAMLLTQIGYAAVAVPGAGQWRDEFQAAFTHARQVIVCFDNDNPAFHDYDKPEKGLTCRKCSGKGLDRCAGHNPGQDAALARIEQIGWRAKNILLPLPNDEARKTDINDFFVRDGNTNADFAELATGKRTTRFQVQTLAEISLAPPEKAAMLIANGILPRAGRLLIAGKPKVGKSIFADNLVLSLASGIPFLKQGGFGGFHVDHPTRTLLLDRELSKSSLYGRLTDLINARPGYRAAMENLLVDHDHLVRLDQRGAYETLLGLVQENGAEVVCLDTAYKFFGGDVESSSSVMKAFEVLDRVLHETGCAFILTHHLRKSAGGAGKTNTDIADPDGVAGSFLWTGWPNATVLLNYLNRSVEDPFNAIATFTAFRDDAAPEPVALYRQRDSIAYSAIEAYREASSVAATTAATPVQNPGRPNTENVSQLLLELCPTTEDDFLHVASARFGISEASVKPYYYDALSSGHFVKTGSRPAIIKYRHDRPEESWEHEHGLPERPVPTIDTEELFDAASLT